MQPALGWALLSRDAIRRAETWLRSDVQGVRDEIGFLGIHQAYADRFFPGTSVLHTRLRYILFVPWIYQRLASRQRRQPFAEALEKEELALTWRLKLRGEGGIIGVDSYPNPTAQTPSMIYWSALGTWRLLYSRPGQALPSRQAFHRMLARSNSHSLVLHDDEHQPMEEFAPAFFNLPKPPEEWDDPSKQLSFRLRPVERTYLHQLLGAVERPGATRTPSLLARIASGPKVLEQDTQLWDARIAQLADPDDRAALRRARQAGALSAIGRGVYSALVEALRDLHDGLPTEDLHRQLLHEVVAAHREDALALNTNELRLDAPSVPGELLSVLEQTQSWIRRSSQKLDELWEPYQRAEARRKGSRARLTKTITGAEKRAEWDAEAAPSPEPLHYRWPNVRRLMLDLKGAP